MLHGLDGEQCGLELGNGGELRQIGGDGGGADGVAIGAGAAGVRRVENHVDLALFDELNHILAHGSGGMMHLNRSFRIGVHTGADLVHDV